ncbi:MAG: hypothetical protein ABJA87_10315 [bacterium]
MSLGDSYIAGEAGWRAPHAVDRSEWVANIRTVTGQDGPLTVQESLHPNYWGQLALRNCLRQADTGGAVRGGECITVDLGGAGWPAATFMPEAGPRVRRP